MTPLGGQVSIEILGQAFTFETQGDLDKARQAAEMVADRVEAAHRKTGGTASASDRVGIVFLVALDMANSYLELKECHQEFLDKIGARSERLASMMAPDAPERKGRNGPDIRMGR